jgi:hypothetical protein
MAKYKMIVLSKPVADREAEYNDWYQNLHLGQVVAIKGFKGAQRFRLSQTMGDGQAYPYLAIYDIETDNLGGVLQDLQGRAGTENMIISGALSNDVAAVVYEEFGAPVKS